MKAHPDVSVAAPPARRWVEYAILIVATLVALEVKRPFGLLANQVLNGHAPPAGAAAYMLGVGELVQLAGVLIACFIHPSTQLPLAPWLERLLRVWPSGRPSPLWRPAAAVIVFVLAYTVVYAMVVAHLGLTSKLGVQLHAPTLPKPVLIRMAMLYPLAALGAAVSEELVYRFALISLLVWLVFLVAPALRRRRTLVLWLVMVAGGLYFGYVHVAENLETVQTGNLVLDVLTTPQSFA